IKEAVERIKPELKAASVAAHKLKDALADVDDEDYQHFDRIVELGYVVDAVGGLCGPHLLLLTEIADALYTIEEGREGPKRREGSKH
ncbi:MAG: hypothetical protein R6X03_06100, partial [Methyloceanibacter sp.]